MSIKIFCDKAGCDSEIDQQQGGGTFVLMTRVTQMDPTTKQIIPQLKQEEFQLCAKHAQEVADFLKDKKVEPK